MVSQIKQLSVVPQSLLFFAVILIYFPNVSSQLVAEAASSSTYRETLDPTENITLEWTVNPNTSTIIFEIEIRQNGYVALALTRRGQLNNSDIIVVGINGTPYFHDMYGANNETIRPDEAEHWRLIGIRNSSNARQSIRIERNLETCDEEDMAIKSELIDVMWDYGNNHSIPTRLNPKGVKRIFFLDPYTLPVSSSSSPQDVNVWRLQRRYHIPARRTSYWCSIHKMTPSLSQRHHIVRFDAYFEDEVSERHTHHYLVYRCRLPTGIDPATVFEEYVNHPGEECYTNENPQLPTAFCREIVAAWAVGGEPLLLPESVGIPIGDTTNEYFMLESHYDNPDERSDLEVVNGVDFQYTPHIRSKDGSFIIIGHGVLGTFVMPPNTSEFNVVGHCSKACTSLMMPLSVNIVGVAPHAHASARRLRLKQYRGTRELPWIINDDDYDFNFQQIRFLQQRPEPVTIMPGDHLTMQCTYDNSRNNGSATVSGFSTADEMCMSFLIVDKRLPRVFCTSEYPTERTMARYGIHNMTWDLDSTERRVNSANDADLVGLLLSEVVGNNSRWTADELEREQMFGSHKESCPTTNAGIALYYSQQLEVVSGGLIPSEQILSATLDLRPTTRSIETPLPLPLPVTFPTTTSIYTPSEVCPKEAATEAVPPVPSPTATSVTTNDVGENPSVFTANNGAEIIPQNPVDTIDNQEANLLRFAVPELQIQRRPRQNQANRFWG